MRSHCSIFCRVLRIPLFGVGALQSVLVATALTATSIAISVRVLTELGKMQTKEAKLILGRAIVDDILEIAVLSVVTTMAQTGNMTPNVVDITFLILKILGYSLLCLWTIFIIPKILHAERLWKSRGSIEGIVTASFFGASGIVPGSGIISDSRSLCRWNGSRKYEDNPTS